ncbi:MAG: OB-fold nucleic acid binding domain-containing protein, partial [Pseudomonadota bacterium]
MRPAPLTPLFASVKTLPGIGPKLAEALTRLLHGQNTESKAKVGDLLFHLPSHIIDRRNRPTIAGSAQGTLATISVRVDRHVPPPRGNPKVPYRVFVHDETGELGLVFFRGQSTWLEKQLPVGEERIVSGRVDWFNGRPTMVHPDYIVAPDQEDALPLVEPVYPMVAGIAPKVLAKAIAGALKIVPALPEWIDAGVVAKKR